MIADNLQQVHGRIARACEAATRAVESVTLLAVSKTFPADAVRAAFTAGQRRFGENYVQEALTKIEALGDLRTRIEWHLIGPLQSNKTREVAGAFDWVHSVDRLKVAQRLNDQRAETLAPLNVCLQVNVGSEDTKGGVTPAGLPELASEVAALPRLALRGLMCIPPLEDDPARQRTWFVQTAQLLRSLHVPGTTLDTAQAM